MSVTHQSGRLHPTTVTPLPEDQREAYHAVARQSAPDPIHLSLAAAEAAPAAPRAPHLAHHFDAPEQQSRAARTGMWVFLATEIMMFGGLFCAYGVFRYLWPEAFHYGHRHLDTGWGLINTVIMILSSFTMAVAVYCAQRDQRQPLMLFLALTIICGVCFLGVKAIEYRHKTEAGLLWGAHFQPVQTDVRTPPVVLPEAMPLVESVPVMAGDPATGKPLYMASCIGCHGNSGEGVEGVGPPLKGSAFVGQTSLAQLSAMIAAGRQPDAPDSVMNALMPPRGGNPFLGDDEIANIAAYVRSLDQEAAGSTAAAGPDEAADVVAALVPRWVGTRPPQSDSGLLPEWRYDLRPSLDSPALPEGVPAHAAKFFGLYFLMTGLHGVHLLIGMGVVAWLLWRASRWHFGRQYSTPVELGGLYWHLVDLVWLFLFPLFYLIH
jgi:cytochrome c oxidase subunit III